RKALSAYPVVGCSVVRFRQVGGKDASSFCPRRRFGLARVVYWLVQRDTRDGPCLSRISGMGGGSASRLVGPTLQYVEGWRVGQRSTDLERGVAPAGDSTGAPDSNQ